MSTATEVLKAYHAGTISRQEIEEITEAIPTMIGISFRFQDNSTILFANNGEIIEGRK